MIPEERVRTLVPGDRVYLYSIYEGERPSGYVRVKQAGPKCIVFDNGDCISRLKLSNPTHWQYWLTKEDYEARLPSELKKVPEQTRPKRKYRKPRGDLD